MSLCSNTHYDYLSNDHTHETAVGYRTEYFIGGTCYACVVARHVRRIKSSYNCIALQLQDPNI